MQILVLMLYCEHGGLKALLTAAAAAVHTQKQ